MDRINLQKLKKIICKKGKVFKTKIELFASLHKTGLYNRLELMIIDSVVKDMALENLHNTLLLTEESYDKVVKTIIKKLLD